MRDNSCLIIYSSNQGKIIEKTIEKLDKIQRNHPSIRQIIIIDNASQDNTKEITLKKIIETQNTTIQLITHIKKIETQKSLETAVKQTIHPNIIITTPTTLPNQVTLLNIIKKLRKTRKVEENNVLAYKNPTKIYRNKQNILKKI